MLYGILHRDRTARDAGDRIDRGQAVALVVGHLQRPQVVRRDHVLRERADRELADDPDTCAGRSRRRCCSRCSGRRPAAGRAARPAPGRPARRPRTRCAGPVAPRPASAEGRPRRCGRRGRDVVDGASSLGSPPHALDRQRAARPAGHGRRRRAVLMPSPPAAAARTDDDSAPRRTSRPPASITSPPIVAAPGVGERDRQPASGANPAARRVDGQDRARLAFPGPRRGRRSRTRGRPARRQPHA